MNDTETVIALSAMELCVLEALSRGSLAKQVAKETGYATGTIKNIKYHLCIKFGVQNSTALVAKAMRLGYIQ